MQQNNQRKVKRERCEFCRSFKHAGFWGKCSDPRSGQAGDRRGDERLTTQDSCGYFKK